LGDLRFIDFFSGIGGFRQGMVRAGHRPVGWCEIDKFAQESYKAIYNIEGEYFNEDARKIKPKELPDFDILAAGFPCQSFSIAGKRKGFEDTRGTLFFEIARIARKKLPKILLLENVKGLLNHSNGETFLKIIKTLDELGYDAEWQVLNSKDFSKEKRPTPQNRERLFIIGHLRGESTRKICPFYRKIRGNIKYAHFDRTQTYRVLETNGISSCCTTSSTGGRQVQKLLTDDGFRQISPKEYWRLQGFPDWAFEKAAEINSDTQLYIQAGNSVTVNVIEAIGERLGD